MKEYSQAKAAAAIAIELSPDSPLGFSCRGKAHFGLGLHEEALTDLSRSIEIDPTLWEGEHFFWRAKIYEQCGQPDLAVRDRESAKKAGFDASDPDEIDEHEQ